MPGRRSTAALAAVVLAAAAFASTEAGGLPPSKLEVGQAGRWTVWWDSSRAPATWGAADPAVADAVAWHAGAGGVEWGELAVGGSGEAWRLRVVVVRFDPARLRLRLVTASREGGTLADWSLDALPPGAVIGFNAGQFTGGQPWGWLVREGIVEQPPGSGALSTAFAVMPDGLVRFIPIGAIPAAGSGGAAEAFQSYPVLLRDDGVVPPQLAAGGLGVDLAHRDARLAIGGLRDGRVLVALTRFDAAGQTLGSLPFGPTVPEMAAIVGALGCRQAVALDGGISAQLAVRDAGGELRTWRGWRKVPLALVGSPRSTSPGP